MTGRAELAMKRLAERLRFDHDALKDLGIIRNDILSAEDFSTAAMNSIKERQILEARLAAAKAANEELARELMRANAKFEMLCRGLGKDRAKEFLSVAAFEEGAAAMRTLAEDARKDAEGGAK